MSSSTGVGPSSTGLPGPPDVSVKIGTVDVVIIIIFFVILFVVAFVSSRYDKKKPGLRTQVHSASSVGSFLGASPYNPMGGSFTSAPALEEALRQSMGRLSDTDQAEDGTGTEREKPDTEVEEVEGVDEVGISLTSPVGVRGTVQVVTDQPSEVEDEEDSDAEGGVTDFFLARKATPWWGIAGSLFASNIGASTFIGVAGTAAQSGLAVGGFEWHACWIVVVFMGWVFMPVFLKSEVFTMPGYLHKRYKSKRLLTGLAWLSLVFAVLADIPGTLYAGTIILQATLGLNMWLSSIVLVLTTAAFSSLGGLSAVIYTDVFQTVVLLVGGCSMLAFSLSHVGGWDQLKAELPPGYFHMIRPMSDEEFPWLGFVFGMPILGITYWCTNQVIVQRVLSARNETHAQAGVVAAGYLKILPVFLMAVPGMCAKVLFPAEVAANPDSAYPLLISRILPEGVLGVMIASMLAAILSSLSSSFNSSATLFTMDIYPSLRASALVTERELVVVGRVFSLALVVPSLLMLPVIANSRGLLLYIQSIYAYIFPQIAVIFLLGVFWTKANEAGALAALITGGVLGIIRLSLETIYELSGKRAEFNKLALIGVNFLIFAVINFVLTTIVMIGFSMKGQPRQHRTRPNASIMSDLAEPLATTQSQAEPRTSMSIAQPSSHPLANLTWWTIDKTKIERDVRRRSDKMIKAAGAVLVAIMIFLFIFFA